MATNKVLAFLEKVGKEVEVVAVDIVTGSVDAVKILTSAQTLTPAFKAAIATLIADAEAIATSSVAAGVADGGNLLADASVAAQVEKLVKDFLSLLPVLKVDVAMLEADIKA